MNDLGVVDPCAGTREVIARSACPSWRWISGSGIPSRNSSTACAWRSWWGAKRRRTPTSSATWCSCEPGSAGRPGVPARRSGDHAEQRTDRQRPRSDSHGLSADHDRSGRRQAHPGPPHTTRHAGPHRAVRSAFPETAVGVGESFQAHGLVPVGVGQGALERTRTRRRASTPSASRPCAGVAGGDTERAEVPVARLWALPLLPAHLPEPAAQPLVELLERQGGVGQREVGRPSDREAVDLLDPPLHRDAPVARGQLARVDPRLV